MAWTIGCHASRGSDVEGHQVPSSAVLEWRTKALTPREAKRVAAAEGFAAELAGKLEASEKRVSELQWQVRMLAEPEGLRDAGAAEAPKGPGGWLAGAVKGCMAPRPGRGR